MFTLDNLIAKTVVNVLRPLNCNNKIMLFYLTLDSERSNEYINFINMCVFCLFYYIY